MQLSGRRALVTGGGRGLGLALARELSSHGVGLVLAGRDEGRLAAAAAELPGTTAVVADVGTTAGRSEIVRVAADAGVDLLVNNAAVQLTYAWLERRPAELLDDITREIAIDLVAPLALTAALLPTLAERDEAAVVTIGSGLALAPKAAAPVYCASKAALRTATRALRYQMEDAGRPVRFVDVILPMVDTEMTRGRAEGRKASPEDVARRVVRGVARGEDEIWVGQARAFRQVMRWAPSLGYRLLRGTSTQEAG